MEEGSIRVGVGTRYGVLQKVHRGCGWTTVLAQPLFVRWLEGWRNGGGGDDALEREEPFGGCEVYISRADRGKETSSRCGAMARQRIE